MSGCWFNIYKLFPDVDDYSSVDLYTQNKIFVSDIILVLEIVSEKLFVSNCPNKCVGTFLSHILVLTKFYEFSGLGFCWFFSHFFSSSFAL